MEEISLEIGCEIRVGSFQKEMGQDGPSNERIYMEILVTMMEVSFVRSKGYTYKEQMITL